MKAEHYKPDPIFIKVDDNWGISVDKYNWIVIRIRENKKEGSKNYGEVYYDQETFHHNLAQAIEKIVKNKTAEGEAPTGSLAAYLAWHEATIHSLADRVLNAKKELQEAMEINVVM